MDNENNLPVTSEVNPSAQPRQEEASPSTMSTTDNAVETTENATLLPTPQAAAEAAADDGENEETDDAEADVVDFGEEGEEEENIAGRDEQDEEAGDGESDNASEQQEGEAAAGGNDGEANDAEEDDDSEEDDPDKDYDFAKDDVKLSCLYCGKCSNILCLKDDIFKDVAATFSNQVYTYDLEILDGEEFPVYSATNPAAVRFDVARVASAASGACRSALIETDDDDPRRLKQLIEKEKEGKESEEEGEEATDTKKMKFSPKDVKQFTPPIDLISCQVQRFSSQHSWFPPYDWCMASCSSCGDHLGWGFAAVDEAATAEAQQRFEAKRIELLKELRLRSKEKEVATATSNKANVAGDASSPSSSSSQKKKSSSNAAPVHVDPNANVNAETTSPLQQKKAEDCVNNDRGEDDSNDNEDDRFATAESHSAASDREEDDDEWEDADDDEAEEEEDDDGDNDDEGGAKKEDNSPEAVKKAVLATITDASLHKFYDELPSEFKSRRPLRVGFDHLQKELLAVGLRNAAMKEEEKRKKNAEEEEEAKAVAAKKRAREEAADGGVQAGNDNDDNATTAAAVDSADASPSTTATSSSPPLHQQATRQSPKWIDFYDTKSADPEIARLSNAIEDAAHNYASTSFVGPKVYKSLAFVGLIVTRCVAREDVPLKKVRRDLRHSSHRSMMRESYQIRRQRILQILNGIRDPLPIVRGRANEVGMHILQMDNDYRNRITDQHSRMDYLEMMALRLVQLSDAMNQTARETRQRREELEQLQEEARRTRAELAEAEAAEAAATRDALSNAQTDSDEAPQQADEAEAATASSNAPTTQNQVSDRDVVQEGGGSESHDPSAGANE